MSGPPLTIIGKLMVHLDPTVMTCRDKYLIKIILKKILTLVEICTKATNLA